MSAHSSLPPDRADSVCRRYSIPCPGVSGPCLHSPPPSPALLAVLVRIHSDLSLFPQLLANTPTLRTLDLTLFPQTRLPSPGLRQGWRGYCITAHIFNHHHLLLQQPLQPPHVTPSPQILVFLFIKPGQNTSASAQQNIQTESRQDSFRELNRRRFHSTPDPCLLACLPAA